MTAGMITPAVDAIRVSIVSHAEEVRVELHDRRAEAFSLFAELGPPQGEQLARDAWAIGLRALHNAHRTAQEAKLADIGGTLVADIDVRLRAHVEEQHRTLTQVLTAYFDPRDGQVSQRLAAFVDDQGALARLLQRYVGPNDSVLSDVLARQVGESSPLFKKLSPTESDGLVKLLAGELQTVMNRSHADLSQALDPLAADGAVGRFLRTLREELKGSNEDRAKQLSAALAALDANDESSLLSRLVRETQKAREDVLAAVNADAPGSPMGLLRASLTKLLQEQSLTQNELAREQASRQVVFEKEIREALTRIETRRNQDLKTTRGGLDFEQAAMEFVTSATRGAPCVFELTGMTAGVGRCKKGDGVLRFTTESAFAGAAVVFEAKRESGFTAQKALDELDEARRNRNASAGVFVMARSHATEGFPAFARHGANVLVVWDHEDSSSDVYLHAAVLLGAALVTRTRTAGEPGDIAALRGLEDAIEHEVARLEKMEKSCGRITKGASEIMDELRVAKGALQQLVGKAKSTLQALHVELRDEAAERASPISFRSDNLQQAVPALREAPAPVGLLLEPSDGIAGGSDAEAEA